MLVTQKNGSTVFYVQTSILIFSFLLPTYTMVCPPVLGDNSVNRRALARELSPTHGVVVGWSEGSG